MPGVGRTPIRMDMLVEDQGRARFAHPGQVAGSMALGCRFTSTAAPIPLTDLIKEMVST